MLQRAIAALGETLRPHLGLSKDRVETLALIVVAMVSARTVNLSHLAAERPGGALVASTYRRLQRFFQHVRLEQDWAAPMVEKLTGLKGSNKWYLALDRTQWQIGGRDVNFLVLAAVTRRFRVPLMWTMIDGRGCSDTLQRIELMRRYLDLFGVESIRMLVADREFIGREWTDFLCENNIPFAIRLRGDLRVTTEQGHELTLDAHLHDRGRGRVLKGWLGAGKDRGRHRLSFAAKPLDGGEWLVVATNVKHRAALDAYRKRWAIENLFGDTKTRGLNIEDTRLTDPEKLALLMGLVALAIAWAARTAKNVLGTRWPPRKSHGYLAQSWFRTGFDLIRNLLRSDPLKAIAPWRRIGQKEPEIRRVV
jgi:DDE family transposase